MPIPAFAFRPRSDGVEVVVQCIPLGLSLRSANALRVSDFAVDNIRAQTGVAELTTLDIDDDDDEALFFGEPEQLG